MKRWIQKVKKETVNDLVLDIAADMDKHTRHVFRADYQHDSGRAVKSAVS